MKVFILTIVLLFCGLSTKLLINDKKDLSNSSDSESGKNMNDIIKSPMMTLEDSDFSARMTREQDVKSV